MTRALPLALLLAACATTAPTPEPTVITRPMPGLDSAPTKLPVASTALPAGLAVDPATIAAPPLELTIRKPERLELPNGLVVYLVEDHATPIVLVRALLPYGRVEDPADKLGLAALTTELLTEGGAGALSAEAFDALLEQHAADVSSGASDEYASVTLSARAADLAKLFPVFADVLQRPRFDEKRFAVVRSRALEAVRRREDFPDAVASRALDKAVFGPDSPLAREPLAKHLEAISAADVKRFYAARATPTGARLVITGDFDAGAVKALLKLHLSSWKGPPAPARTWPAPAKLSRRVIFVPREVAQVKIRIGAWGFQRNAPEEYALRLVNTALGSFGVGRLYREIRDERGLAYSAYSQLSPGPTTGLFLAGFDTRPAQAVKALEVGLSILERAGAAQPLTAPELATAVDMSLNAFAFRFDTAARVGFERALYEQLGYPADYLETFRDRTAGVTLAQANQAARRFSEGLQIVALGPKALEPALAAFGPVTVISDVEQFR